MGKFCDDGEKDGVLTADEFCAGIEADTKDLSDDDFKAAWLGRMDGCITDAAAAKPDMKAAIEKLVEAFNTHYNADNFEEAAKVFAPECDVTVNGGADAGGFGPYKTRAEIVGFLTALKNDMKCTSFALTPTGENLDDDFLGSSDTWTTD